MKHLTLGDFSPDNYRLVVEVPDSNFSPERNYKIIEQVLAENDKMQRKLRDQVKDNAGNVADILTSFAKYKLDRDGGKKLEQWLGREAMKAIYGPKLWEKAQKIQAIRAENLKKGNTKFLNYYLT